MKQALGSRCYFLDAHDGTFTETSATSVSLNASIRRLSEIEQTCSVLSRALGHRRLNLIFTAQVGHGGSASRLGLFSGRQTREIRVRDKQGRRKEDEWTRMHGPYVLLPRSPSMRGMDCERLKKGRVSLKKRGIICAANIANFQYLAVEKSGRDWA